MTEQLFYKKLHSLKRTYFFNVTKNENNELYLQIVESRAKKNGKYDRVRISIHLKDCDDFKTIFEEALEALKENE